MFTEEEVISSKMAKEFIREQVLSIKMEGCILELLNEFEEFLTALATGQFTQVLVMFLQETNEVPEETTRRWVDDGELYTTRSFCRMLYDLYLH